MARENGPSVSYSDVRFRDRFERQRGRSTFIAFRFAMTRSVAAGSCRSGSVTSSLCVFQREMCAIENVTQTPPKSREDL
jgi:hypothetical protein